MATPHETTPCGEAKQIAIMTYDAEDTDDTTRAGARLRIATLVIGSVEIIAFTLFIHLMLQSTDGLGAAIGQGMSALIAIPIFFLVVPGIILAWLDRAPKIALALVVAALPFAGLLWVQA